MGFAGKKRKWGKGGRGRGEEEEVTRGRAHLEFLMLFERLITSVQDDIISKNSHERERPLRNLTGRHVVAVLGAEAVVEAAAMLNFLSVAAGAVVIVGTAALFVPKQH